MTAQIDVVIPIFGGWPLTRSCLEHLRLQSAPHNVFVVDNRSPDDSGKLIRADFPEVRIVEMGENTGFAMACNAGIAAGSAPIVVLLNNDVDAEPQLLERLAAPFASQVDLGSAVPLLTRPDGRIDSLGLCADKTLAGFPRLAGERPSRATTAPLLLGPSGACGAFRRTALDEVGGLDTNIFMYQEDLDLAIRLRSAGWRTIEVPEARGIHQVSATVGHGSRFQRETAGFARGYMLGKFGIMRSGTTLRALVTECAAALADALKSRDLAGARGRLRGWKRSAPVRSTEQPAGLDPAIGLIESFKMRTTG